MHDDNDNGDLYVDDYDRSLICSLPAGEMEGPYSARFPSSSIGRDNPTSVCPPGGC